MVSVALQSLTGADADGDAWDKIFRHFNKTTRKLERGYQKGEVVAVKINLNNSGTRKKDNLCDATPQMVLAVVPNSSIKRAFRRKTSSFTTLNANSSPRR